MPVTYPRPIDSHVHLRWNEKRVPLHFVKLGFKHARAVGLAAVIEQPNTKDPLTGREIIRKRLGVAVQDAFREGVHHGMYVAFTPDRNQQRGAMTLVGDSSIPVYGDKTFTVMSTQSGEIEIIDPEQQKQGWQHKGTSGYKGVSLQHLEDGTRFTGEFDPASPITHSLRQNPESELIQAERQLKFAYDAGFQGTFYICHVSNPETISCVEAFRKMRPSFRTVLEMTFHHSLLNTTDYAILGNGVKMNPPLRPPWVQEQLLEALLAGRIDVIATDHAPHEFDEKFGTLTPASGIQTIPFWPKAFELYNVAGMKKGLWESLTFYAPNEIFGLGFEAKPVTVEYQPELWKDYGYNPFMRIDGTL